MVIPESGLCKQKTRAPAGKPAARGEKGSRSEVTGTIAEVAFSSAAAVVVAAVEPV
jgi:hypothetical protein